MQFPRVPHQLLSIMNVLKKTKQFTADSGELFPIPINGKIVLLAGVGKRQDCTFTALCINVRRAILSPFISKLTEVEMIPFEQNDTFIRAIIDGFKIGTYAWNKYRKEPLHEPTVDTRILHIVSSKTQSYLDASLITEGVNLARNLINDNADIVTSVYLESVIKNLVKGQKNISLEILNKKQLKAKGLNLHLAVNQGSAKEPKLIIVQYRRSTKKGNSTAIIGKGITFDTGGLNLKPTGSIETMRSDMSGAACVIGTLKNVIKLNLKKNIIFAVGIAENAIGKEAYKPGDVIKSYSGKTVEIGNTDAEGRLVLADAIGYVVRNYKPSRIIDIATLTGACVIALGHDYSGLVSSDDKLVEQLIRSSQLTDDRIWRLPSYSEMKEYIKSLIADLKNVGLPKGAAGALTAAEFLKQFTENTPWAHLDIAGTAYAQECGRLYFGYGATGVGVRLLTHYLNHN